MVPTKKFKMMIIGCYPPPFGGQSVHIKELHTFLKNQGIDAKVLNIGIGRKTPGRDYFTVRNPFDFIMKLIFFSLKGFAFHLHTHGHSFKSWLLVSVCSAITKVLGRNLYLTLHSGMCPYYLRSCYTFPKMLIKLGLLMSRYVIAVNEEIYTSLAALGISASKLAVIEAFSLTNNFNEANPSAELKDYINTHRPLITCVGFPRPEYGLHLLEPLVNNLKDEYPDLGLLVIGATSPNEEEIIVNHQSIKWLGLQDHAISLFLIGKSDLFIRPSLADGDAISVREAMTLNIPVVASNVGCRPNGVITFKAGDIMDLTLSIKKALQICRTKRKNSSYMHYKNLQRILRCYS